MNHSRFHKTTSGFDSVRLQRNIFDHCQQLSQPQIMSTTWGFQALRKSKLRQPEPEVKEPGSARFKRRSLSRKRMSEPAVGQETIPKPKKLYDFVDTSDNIEQIVLSIDKKKKLAEEQLRREKEAKPVEIVEEVEVPKNIYVFESFDDEDQSEKKLEETAKQIKNESSNKAKQQAPAVQGSSNVQPPATQLIKKSGLNIPEDKKSQSSNLVYQDEISETVAQIHSPVGFAPDIHEIMAMPLREGFRVRCLLKRKRSNLYLGQITYLLMDELGKHVLLACQKAASPGYISSHYVMSTNQHSFKEADNTYAGKIKANFTNSKFYVFDEGHNPKKAADPGVHKPLRKNLCTVFFRRENESKKIMREIFVPKSYAQCLKEGYSEAEEVSMLANREKYIGLEQVVHDIDQSDIKKQGLMIQDSEKNMWIKEERTVFSQLSNITTKAQEEQTNGVFNLVFYKIQKDLFRLEFGSPFSLRSAFGVCMTSFDLPKLV